MKKIIFFVIILAPMAISLAQDFRQVTVRRGQQLPNIAPADSMEIIYIDTTNPQSSSGLSKWEGLYLLSKGFNSWMKIPSLRLSDDTLSSSFIFECFKGTGPYKDYEPLVILPTSDNREINLAWHSGNPFTNSGGLIYFKTAFRVEIGQLAIQANGEIPIGNGNGPPTIATITGPHAISVTNGVGSITLSFKAPVTLIADGETINTNVSESDHFRVTLTDDFSINNPIDPTDGQTVTWEFIQDGSGNRVIALDSKFSFGTDITSITLTTTANKRDFMKATYNSITDKWYIIDFKKGY